MSPPAKAGAHIPEAALVGSMGPRLRGDDSRLLEPLHSSLDAGFGQQPLGAVVPDVHLHDLAVAHDEAIDVTVDVERRSVRQVAVQEAEVVDHGVILARAEFVSY